MKTKLLFLTALVVYSMFGFSQKKYLIKIVSSTTENTYSYNLSDQLEKKNLLGDLEIREEFFYNNEGLCEHLDTYQKLNEEWVKVSFIDYKYDTKGNRIERANYNVDLKSGEFYIGAIIRNEYDDNNNMILKTTYMPLGEEKPMEKQTFFYEKDLLTGWKVENNEDPFGSAPQWFTNSTGGYIYDSLNRLVIDSTVNIFPGNDIRPATKIEYKYDQNGNIDRYDYYMPGSSSMWVLKNYHSFEYDLSQSAKEYVLPIDPESNNFVLQTMTNERIKDVFYVRDDQTNELGIAETYTYEYLTDSNIEEVEVSEKYIYPNPVESSFSVNFPFKETPLYIYDAQGKLVLSYNKVSSVVEVSNLASGIYWIKCGEITAKMIKK